MLLPKSCSWWTGIAHHCGIRSGILYGGAAWANATVRWCMSRLDNMLLQGWLPVRPDIRNKGIVRRSAATVRRSAATVRRVCCHCQTVCCHCQTVCCHCQTVCCHCQTGLLPLSDGLLPLSDGSAATVRRSAATVRRSAATVRPALYANDHPVDCMKHDGTQL
jgi:hypothetical protein